MSHHGPDGIRSVVILTSMGLPVSIGQDTNLIRMTTCFVRLVLSQAEWGHLRPTQAADCDQRSGLPCLAFRGLPAKRAANLYIGLGCFACATTPLFGER